MDTYINTVDSEQSTLSISVPIHEANTFSFTIMQTGSQISSGEIKVFVVSALPVLVAPTTGLSHELRKVNDF